MKYHSSLINLESELIRLDMVTSMMNILGNGASTSDTTDLQNAIWFMQEVLTDIRDKSSWKFQSLFDEIREDTFQRSEEFEDDECNELTEIVNSWVNNP